jgi:hypothetical protein
VYVIVRGLRIFKMKNWEENFLSCVEVSILCVNITGFLDRCYAPNSVLLIIIIIIIISHHKLGVSRPVSASSLSHFKGLFKGTVDN